MTPSMPLTGLARDTGRVANKDGNCIDRTSGTGVFAVLLMVVSVLLGAMPAQASVTIDSVELVEKTRVGRTTINYTYRVTATNNAPVTVVGATAYLSLRQEDPVTVVEATAQLPSGQPNLSAPAPPYLPNAENGRSSSGSSGTTLIDDIVTLGNIGPGGTVTSDDTYTIQQDRSVPFDAGSLIWEVGYTATLRLSGEIKDQAIPNAVVNIVVDRGESGRPIIESGRPIIESFTTTADSAGRYSVDVIFVADADFVNIKGNGIEVFDFVELSSIAGSAGTLLQNATELPSRGGPGLLLLDGADYNPLNATHVSTALARLALQANGGVGITNDATLADAQAQVVTQELITMAAVLKTVIDNANVPLPPGINTTQELVDNPGAFNDYLVSLQENFPDELQAAIEETIIDLSTGYVAADVPQTLYLSFSRGDPLLDGANVFTFEPDGSATHISNLGEATDAQWALEDADIVVSLNDSPMGVAFPLLEVPPGSGNFQQVLESRSITELRIARVSVGLLTDQVLLGSTILKTYPDFPGVLPDVTTITAPNPQSGYLAFDAEGILPITSAELNGQTIALPYLHAANDNPGGVTTPEYGVDLLQFNANGTGATARRNFAFTWAVDNLGRLVITFANGDQTEYALYSQPQSGIVDFGVVVGRYGAGLVRAFDMQAVTMAVGTQFDNPTLVNQKFRSGSFILDPEFNGSIFDFNFFPSGEGCRAFIGYFDFSWMVNPQGYMQLEKFFNNGSLNRTRAWQAVAVVPGLLGDRYWVIENLDLARNDPGFPHDPTQFPGRLNFYENVMDISGNTPPTAVDDVASTAMDTSVLIDVLANDNDAQGNTQITSFSTPTLGGTVTEEYDASRIIGLRYTPPPGVTDFVDTFTYTVGDDVCSESVTPATVSVTVGTPATTITYSWTGYMEPGSPKEPNPWNLAGNGEVEPVNDDGTPYEITVSVASDAVDIDISNGALANFPVSAVDLTIGGIAANVTNAELSFQDNVINLDKVKFIGDVELDGVTISFVGSAFFLDQNTFALSPTPAQDPLPVFASTSNNAGGVFLGPVITTTLSGTPVVVGSSNVGVGGRDQESTRQTVGLYKKHR